ncbi:MAG: hypothetical protein P8H32_02025 [Oceanicoccus sp.]|uniref:hypothetical protein n=1 Tax=Oceanicoccus sp. TaxID=2691044 RepID=UPI00261704BE|nr:hypothetical protein [Oceanicoccus sp.]MDG1772194.1 hypothetical protein [Oceanicoccus sp.]
MTDQDSTQSAPLVSPHYALLSHPLVHTPSSHSYSDCLDVLENAINLLALFHNLEFEENSNRGALSPNAAGAFYCLIIMLQDTLRYVCENLDDAWRDRESCRVDRTLQKTVFFKALQEPTMQERTGIYNTMAACMGVNPVDIETFVGLIEKLGDSTPDTRPQSVAP